MEAPWIMAVCNGSWSHFTHETFMYGYTTQDEKIVFRSSPVACREIGEPWYTTQDEKIVFRRAQMLRVALMKRYDIL